MDVRLDWIGNKCSDVYQSEPRQGWIKQNAQFQIFFVSLRRAEFLRRLVAICQV